MRRHIRLLALIAIVFVFSSRTIHAQSVITTEPPNNALSWSGWVDGFIFGQTFSAPNPVDVILASFMLSGVRVDPGQPGTFTAYLAEWNDATSVAGPQLWSESGAGLNDVYQSLTFSLNTALSFGTKYIFALLTDAAFGSARATDLNGNHYPGGGLYFQNGATPDAPWNGTFSQIADITFTAEFSPTAVPEPATLVLLSTGLVGLAGAARRRRKGVVVATTL